MNTFEILRDLVPIEKVVRRYSEVKGNKAHCLAPEHQDANPSMHLYDDHVHCFACGFHGDVTHVQAVAKGFDQPIEAAWDLAREYGIEMPERNPEAQKKAQQRREKEDRYLKQAQACHRALDRYPEVREWWNGRGFAKEYQERFLLGVNKDGTVAVIPFWNRGRVKGLIRRKLEGQPKYLYPKTEEFPEGHKPLFVPGPVRAGGFLIEGFVDALALVALGESAVAVGGTGISEEQMQELERIPGPLYILPDADKEGAEAARDWTRQLYPKALLCPAEYGGEAEDA